MFISPNVSKTNPRKIISITAFLDNDEDLIRSESDLWYRVKNTLISMGHDVIKKQMTKDGHLVSDGVYYVRTRKQDGFGSYMIYDDRYAIRNIKDEMNTSGMVKLDVTGDFPAPQKSVKDWRPKY